MAIMRYIKIGAIRVNLDQLLWYMPSGDPASDKDLEQPAITLMVSHHPAAMTVRYSSFEVRDKELARIDAMLLARGSESATIKQEERQPLDAPGKGD